jgi:hypothetical protein
MQMPASAAAQGVFAEGLHRLVSMDSLPQCPLGMFLTICAVPPVTTAEQDTHEDVYVSVYEL